MKKTLSTLLISLLLTLQSCNFNKADIIQMNHYFGGVGLQLKYQIDGNNLIVKSNCDFEDCSEKIIYERKLSGKESKELITKIKLLKPDTLNNEYINPHILDGQYTEIYFGQRIDINQNKVIIQNINLTVVDSLTRYIDDLIVEKRFKLKTFGQE